MTDFALGFIFGLLFTLFVLFIQIPVHAEGRGYQLFKDNCVVCHGPDGQGDGPAAPGFTPRPRNLTKDPFKNGDSVEQIKATISNGYNLMPSFGHLTDDDRLALAKYVKGLRQ